MKEKVQRLMEAQQVKAVMAQLDRDEKRMVDDQIELCAINSPSNQEESRAKRYEEMFRELALRQGLDGRSLERRRPFKKAPAAARRL